MVPGPGLAELALKEAVISDVLHVCSRPENLAILLAGEAAGEPARVYRSSVLVDVVNTLRRDFCLIVVDLPEANLASPLVRLSGFLDGVLLVVAANGVRREAARRTKELLTRSEVPLLGAVLNKRRQELPRWLCNER